MRSLLILLAAMSGIAALSAQPITREWYRSEPWLASPSHVEVDRLGNIYAHTRVYDGSHYVLRVVKHQPTGGVIWERRFAKARGIRTAVASDQEGNSYFADFTYQNDTVVALLFKVSSDGAIQWERILDDVEQWNAITIDQSGDLLVTGNSRISQDETVVTAKFKSSGEEVWRRNFRHARYPGFGWQQGFEVVNDIDGTAYILADIGNRPANLTLLKYSTSGQLIWTRDIVFSSGPTQFALGLTKDRKCIVATGANHVINVLSFDSAGVMKVVGTGTVNVERPGIRGIVNVGENGYLVYGSQVYARVINDTLQIVKSEGAVSALSGSGRELYLGDSKVVNHLQTYGTLSALFDAYYSELPFYSWQERFYGVPDPSNSYRYGSVTALNLDSNGDLIAGGFVTMSTGLRAFVAKYRCDPVAAPDVYDVRAGVAIDVTQPGILINDAQTKAAMLSLAMSPANGTLNLASDGSFIYRPDAGFAGRDYAYYRLTRGTITSVAAIEFRVFPALVDAKFTPIKIKGGTVATLRAKVETPFQESTLLPVTGSVQPITSGGDSIYFAPGAEWGARTMQTAPVSVNTAVTVTIRSGESTRSATVTVTP